MSEDLVFGNAKNIRYSGDVVDCKIVTSQVIQRKVPSTRFLVALRNVEAIELEMRRLGYMMCNSPSIGRVENFMKIFTDINAEIESIRFYLESGIYCGAGFPATRRSKISGETGAVGDGAVPASAGRKSSVLGEKRIKMMESDKRRLLTGAKVFDREKVHANIEGK